MPTTILFTDGDYVCRIAFSVPVHRGVGTANLTGEDKGMVIMQGKNGDERVWWTSPNGDEERNRRGEPPRKCAMHTLCRLAQDFSSWAASSESQAERRDIYGISVRQRKKYGTVRNDRKMRVLDDGKQHMGNKGEGAFGIIAAAYIPA